MMIRLLILVLTLAAVAHAQSQADLILHNGGKLADLTVLTKNLLKVAPKEFLTTQVLYTIVDGKVVYQYVPLIRHQSAVIRG